MPGVFENGIVVGVHAHAIGEHLLLVVQEGVCAKVIGEVGAFVRLPEGSPRHSCGRAASIAMPIHGCCCYSTFRLSLDSPPHSSQTGTRRRTVCGTGGGGEERLCNSPMSGDRVRAAADHSLGASEAGPVLREIDPQTRKRRLGLTSRAPPWREKLWRDLLVTWRDSFLTFPFG